MDSECQITLLPPATCAHCTGARDSFKPEGEPLPLCGDRDLHSLGTCNCDREHTLVAIPRSEDFIVEMRRAISEQRNANPRWNKTGAVYGGPDDE